MAEDRTGDEFLTGYIAYIVSILERNLRWERDNYILKIINGVATITLFKREKSYLFSMLRFKRFLVPTRRDGKLRRLSRKSL